MSFINAEWRKLAIANYSIDPSILAKYVPVGTELDVWNNTCYVSLVGFMFVNTRVLGVSIPFHTNFEEVNLRFYVKRKENGAWRRGVVFIKELVPRKAITLIANLLYKEHYQTVAMHHHWTHQNNELLVKYAWEMQGKNHSIQLITGTTPQLIEDGSEEEFITEHYWGYTKVNAARTIEYEVKHPKWDCYRVNEYQIEVDFEANYGVDFKFLNDLKPKSVFLAEGSNISVEGKKYIE